VILVGVLVAGAAAFGGFLWSTRTGARCRLDEDCRSRSCLLLVRGRGVCTEPCRDDAGCPDDMYCGEATRGGPPSGLDPRTGLRRVCVPTGQRLRDLLGD